MDAEGHLAALRSIADNLEYDIIALVKETSKVNNDKILAQEAASEEEKLFAERREEMRDIEARLDADIASKQDELDRINNDITPLITKKGDLKIENARLSDENTKLKAYEVKAWKALETKETSLLDREQALEQRENLKPVKRSLLPPVN